MELAPDSVVFVFDPRLATDPTHDRLGIFFRRCEHELQRMHQPQLRRPQLPAAGERGDLAQVAGQHAGPGDVGQRCAEGFRDPLFDQPRPKTDAQVAGQDLADVFRLPRAQPVEQLAQRLRFLFDGALLVDPDEGLVHITQGCRLRVSVACEHLLDHVADIAVPHVGLAEHALVDAGDLADGLADDGVAEIQLPLVAVGEGTGGEIDGRQRQRLVVEPGEVLAEQPRLLQLAVGGADCLARSGERLHSANPTGSGLRAER